MLVHHTKGNPHTDSTRVTATSVVRMRGTRHSNHGYRGYSCLHTVFCMLYEQADPRFKNQLICILPLFPSLFFFK